MSRPISKFWSMSKERTDSHCIFFFFLLHFFHTNGTTFTIQLSVHHTSSRFCLILSFLHNTLVGCAHHRKWCVKCINTFVNNLYGKYCSIYVVLLYKSVSSSRSRYIAIAYRWYKVNCVQLCNCVWAVCLWGLRMYSFPLFHISDVVALVLSYQYGCCLQNTIFKTNLQIHCETPPR